MINIPTLLAVALVSVSVSAAPAAKPTKPNKPSTNQTMVKKKQPPKSKVRPAVKKPSKVTNKAVIKKK